MWNIFWYICEISKLLLVLSCTTGIFTLGDKIWLKLYKNIQARYMKA